MEKQAEDRIQLVRHFCEVFEQEVNHAPVVPSDDVIALRKKLIMEEFVIELFEGLDEGNLNKILDALCDSLYVLYGTAVACGLDGVLDAAFREVHRSNMSKLGVDGKPMYDAKNYNKVMKGPNYTKPNLEPFLDGASS